jgi:hypothetical protein
MRPKDIYQHQTQKTPITRNKPAMSQVKSTNNLNAVNLVISLNTDQSVKFAQKVRPVTGIGNYTSDRRPQPVPNLVMTGART